MFIPQLSEQSKQVLQLIREHGVCKGKQLVSESGLTPERLVDAVKELVAYELISMSGSTFSPKEIGHAYFNIRPSNASLAELVLR